MEHPYLNALPSALIAVDGELSVRYLNQAAEMLFDVSAHTATGRPLSALPAIGSELCDLCAQVYATRQSVSLFAYELPLPHSRSPLTLHLTPIITESAREVLIAIEKADGMHRLAASERKQDTARAAGVMAAMLAHEVKNPLSGIRGAAQLLKDEVAPEHQSLAELICLETDRIRNLLAEVEIFATGAPDARQPVNIHEVLQYVISLAKNGFAPHVAFNERYDPSLPLVLGRRDLLVQMFLNLLKNSAEAMARKPDAVITIATTYRSGYRMRHGESEQKTALPVAVTIEDNGPGITDDIRRHLFEPFVSSKEEGRGLGLAIVAKIASDLGAVVELDKDFEPGTRFTVWLAVAS